MPRKCGLCKKEGHNRNNCENAHYEGKYNYKGERHGKGTYEYKLSKYKKTSLENAKYEGDWVNGKREGKGKMVIINFHGRHTWQPKGGGSKYNGEWKNDKRHGKGTMKCNNGTILKDGVWKNDKFEGKIEFKDGAILMGKFNHYGVICDGTPGILKTDNMIITGLFGQSNRYLAHKSHNYRLGKGMFTYKRQNYTVKSLKCRFEISVQYGQNTPNALQVMVSDNYPYSANATITHESGNSLPFNNFCWSRNNFCYGGNNKLIKQWLKENIYTGDYNSKKQKHGKGIMIYANDNKYDGDWVNDKREGKGVITFSTGGKYDGKWLKGHKVKGVMTFANGDKYDGCWSKGVRNGDIQEGKGVMFYMNGDKYDGEWVKGFKEGKGVMTYVGGNKYDGNWVKEWNNGKGVMTYANGDKYDGKWSSGSPNGIGVKTYKNGDKYMGNWNNGNICARHETNITYANGDKYKGTWNVVKLTGVMTYVTGEKFVGNWLHEKKEGYGSFFNKEGIEYRGQWKNDKKVGHFFLFKGNNYCNVCKYKDDKLLKKYKSFKDKSIE